MCDPSLTNHDLKTPDFKVSTRYFDVEHAPKWGRLGEQDDYFWKTPNETTVNAMKELEDGDGQKYQSVKEFFNDLREDLL